MRVLVVGAGEMGRWVAETLSAHGPAELSLAFTDADPAVARDAADSLDGRALPSEPDETIDCEPEETIDREPDETFDLVVIAVPIPAVASAIESYAERAERAMVDVAGVMADPLEAMAANASTIERASFHPLFAPHNAPGSIAVVPQSSGPVTDRVRETLTAAGNDVFETTAAEHDRAMETVQARAHAAILAFGLAAEPVPEEFETPIAEQLISTLDAVTGNDPRVYADVQAAFDGAEDIAAAAKQLADADHETVQRLYRAAGTDEDVALRDVDAAQSDEGGDDE